MFKMVNFFHQTCFILRVNAVFWKVISGSDTPEKKLYLLEIRTEESSVLSSGRRTIRVLHFKMRVCKDMFDDVDKDFNKYIFYVFFQVFMLFYLLYKHLKWIN